MSKITAMQDLKSDLLDTKISTYEALTELVDKNLMDIINSYVQSSLDTIIERIDSELLEIEEKQIVIAWIEGKENREFGDNVFEDGKKYYNTNFKNNENEK